MSGFTGLQRSWWGVVLVGSFHRDHGPGVGSSQALFLYGGELSPSGGVVLAPSFCPLIKGKISEDRKRATLYFITLYCSILGQNGFQSVLRLLTMFSRKMICFVNFPRTNHIYAFDTFIVMQLPLQSDYAMLFSSHPCIPKSKYTYMCTCELLQMMRLIGIEQIFFKCVLSITIARFTCRETGG